MKPQSGPATPFGCMITTHMYLVPSFLAEKDKPLGAVEMPDVSGIWDQDPGVTV